MSRPRIISYLWFLRKSSTWKFHVIIFVASNPVSKISTLLWCFVWNSTPWVSQMTGDIYFLRSFFVSFLNIIEELAPGSNNIFR